MPSCIKWELNFQPNNVSAFFFVISFNYEKTTTLLAKEWDKLDLKLPSEVPLPYSTFLSIYEMHFISLSYKNNPSVADIIKTQLDLPNKSEVAR